MKIKTEKIKKFFASRGGKSVIVVSSCLLLALAVFLNYKLFYNPLDAIGYGTNNMENNYDDAQTVGAAEDSASTYFTATALTRSQSRAEALDVLKTVADNEEADEAARAEAAEKISKIAVNIQNEANIETLVKAKGYEDCVAVIGDDSVSVIVRADSLRAAEAAEIFTIAYETTGVSPEKISIMTK